MYCYSSSIYIWKINLESKKVCVQCGLLQSGKPSLIHVCGKQVEVKHLNIWSDMLYGNYTGLWHSWTQFSWKPLCNKGYDLEHFQVIWPWRMIVLKMLIMTSSCDHFSFQSNLECVHKWHLAFLHKGLQIFNRVKFSWSYIKNKSTSLLRILKNAYYSKFS